MWRFFLTWLACFIHAWWRRRAAWREQAWAISALAVVCVLLNAASTGGHPLRAATRDMWAVAGMDMMLLAAAALAGCSQALLATSVSPVWPWRCRNTGKAPEGDPDRHAPRHPGLSVSGDLLLCMAFAICIGRDGALLWGILMSASAIAVALTLSWCPQLLLWCRRANLE